MCCEFLQQCFEVIDDIGVKQNLFTIVISVDNYLIHPSQMWSFHKSLENQDMRNSLNLTNVIFLENRADLIINLVP